MDLFSLIISAVFSIGPVGFFMLGPILLITSIHQEAWGDVLVFQPGAAIGLCLCAIDLGVLIGAVAASCL